MIFDHIDFEVGEGNVPLNDFEREQRMAGGMRGVVVKAIGRFDVGAGFADIVQQAGNNDAVFRHVGADVFEHEHELPPHFVGVQGQTAGVGPMEAVRGGRGEKVVIFQPLDQSAHTVTVY